MTKLKVGEILIRAGLIDEMQLRAALGDQGNWGQRLGVTLVKMGLLEERDLVRALAEQLQLPVVQLEGKRVQPEVLALVPLDFAEKHLCIPLFVKEQGGTSVLYVGMEDPSDLDAIDELGFRTGLKVRPVLVSPSEVCEAIDRLYRRDCDAGRGQLDSRSDIDLDFGSARRRTGFEHVPAVEESLFQDLGELPESGTPVESAPVAAPAAPVEDSGEATNKTILRALCHLLIEKQVISREELQSLVRLLSADESIG